MDFERKLTAAVADSWRQLYVERGAVRPLVKLSAELIDFWLDPATDDQSGFGLLAWPHIVERIAREDVPQLSPERLLRALQLFRRLKDSRLINLCPVPSTARVLFLACVVLDCRHERGLFTAQQPAFALERFAFARDRPHLWAQTVAVVQEFGMRPLRSVNDPRVECSAVPMLPPFTPGYTTKYKPQPALLAPVPPIPMPPHPARPPMNQPLDSAQWVDQLFEEERSPSRQLSRMSIDDVSMCRDMRRRNARHLPERGPPLQNARIGRSAIGRSPVAISRRPLHSMSPSRASPRSQLPDIPPSPLDSLDSYALPHGQTPNQAFGYSQMPSHMKPVPMPRSPPPTLPPPVSRPGPPLLPPMQKPRLPSRLSVRLPPKNIPGPPLKLPDIPVPMPMPMPGPPSRLPDVPAHMPVPMPGPPLRHPDVPPPMSQPVPPSVLPPMSMSDRRGRGGGSVRRGPPMRPRVHKGPLPPEAFPWLYQLEPPPRQPSPKRNPVAVDPRVPWLDESQPSMPSSPRDLYPEMHESPDRISASQSQQVQPPRRKSTRMDMPSPAKALLHRKRISKPAQVPEDPSEIEDENAMDEDPMEELFAESRRRASLNPAQKKKVRFSVPLDDNGVPVKRSSTQKREHERLERRISYSQVEEHEELESPEALEQAMGIVDENEPASPDDDSLDEVINQVIRRHSMTSKALSVEPAGDEIGDENFVKDGNAYASSDEVDVDWKPNSDIAPSEGDEDFVDAHGSEPPAEERPGRKIRRRSMRINKDVDPTPSPRMALMQKRSSTRRNSKEDGSQPSQRKAEDVWKESAPEPVEDDGRTLDEHMADILELVGPYFETDYDKSAFDSSLRASIALGDDEPNGDPAITARALAPLKLPADEVLTLDTAVRSAALAAAREAKEQAEAEAKEAAAKPKKRSEARTKAKEEVKKKAPTKKGKEAEEVKAPKKGRKATAKAAGAPTLSTAARAASRKKKMSVTQPPQQQQQKEKEKGGTKGRPKRGLVARLDGIALHTDDDDSEEEKQEVPQSARARRIARRNKLKH